MTWDVQTNMNQTQGSWRTMRGAPYPELSKKTLPGAGILAVKHRQPEATLWPGQAPMLKGCWLLDSAFAQHLKQHARLSLGQNLWGTYLSFLQPRKSHRKLLRALKTVAGGRQSTQHSQWWQTHTHMQQQVSISLRAPKALLSLPNTILHQTPSPLPMLEAVTKQRPFPLLTSFSPRTQWGKVAVTISRTERAGGKVR